MLYLDDLSVGQRFISNRYEMRLEEILQFAKQYDPQSFHTDTEAAKQHQIFKGLLPVVGIPLPYVCGCGQNACLSPMV